MPGAATSRRPGVSGAVSNSASAMFAKPPGGLTYRSQRYRPLSSTVNWVQSAIGVHGTVARSTQPLSGPSVQPWKRPPTMRPAW